MSCPSHGAMSVAPHSKYLNHCDKNNRCCLYAPDTTTKPPSTQSRHEKRFVRIKHKIAIDNKYSVTVDSSYELTVNDHLDLRFPSGYSACCSAFDLAGRCFQWNWSTYSVTLVMGAARVKYFPPGAKCIFKISGGQQYVARWFLMFPHKCWMCK